MTGSTTATTNRVTRLYRNLGNNSFTLAITNLPAPQDAHGYWADYDNDGDVDLLQAGSAATYLLRNEGDGVFTNASLSLPGQHRVISPWGDFDGDGDLDFITSSGPYPFIGSGLDYDPSFTRNDGTGTFNSSFDYSLDMWLFSASWGDVGNDGRASVVVSGWVPLVPGGGAWGSATRVYINLGNTWQQVFTLGGWDNRSETWVDFDGDGDLDIFTTGGQLTTFWENCVAWHRDFPQAPLNPTATFTALDAVTLSWQTPANTPATGRGLSYNVRVGRTPGSSDVASPMADVATGRRLIQTSGNAGSTHLFKLNNVPPGTYYWSVQSIGQSYTGIAVHHRRDVYRHEFATGSGDPTDKPHRAVGQQRRFCHHRHRHQTTRLPMAQGRDAVKRQRDLLRLHQPDAHDFQRPAASGRGL